MHALQNDRTDTVYLLLDNGAALDLPKDPNHHTPLMVACGRSDRSMVLLLLEKGARLDSVDRRGRSAMDYASLRPEITRLLSERSQLDEQMLD